MSEQTQEQRIAAEVERRIAALLEKKVEALLARPQREYLSIKEAAALCGVSTKHIRRAIKSGELPCSNVGGKKRATYRIARQAIAAWMEANRVKACQSKSQRDSLVEQYFGPQRKRRAA